MFVVFAGPAGSLKGDALAAPAARLRSGPAARNWRDEQRRGAVAVTVAGLLPEDRYDRQPLVARDLVFVCRVRLDNRQELAERLALSPAQTRDMADSAMLLLAYRRWGDTCVQYLVGCYAFVAWHPEQGRVVAAVDHQGQARLYWTLVDGGLLLSGELAALLAHPTVPRQPDLAALAQVLHGGLDRQATPFAGVRALPGGHLLRWRLAGPVRVVGWWHPQSRPPSHHHRHQDYADQAAELLDQAVASQLRAVGPVSSTLSGGLDSGLVTATAARQLAARGQRLTAYTSVPEPGLACSSRPGWEPDDSAYAAELAAGCGNVEHVLVPPGGRCSLDLLPQLFGLSRTPMRALTNLLWMDEVSRLDRAAGSRVVLNGQKGNATISWPGPDAAGAAAEAFAGRRWRAALALARADAAARVRPLWQSLGASVLGPRARALAYRARHGDGLYDRPPGGMAFLQPPWRSGWQRPGLFAPPPGTRQHWLAFVRATESVWHPDNLLVHGVEWRDPLADRRLVETLLGFPLEAFIDAEGRSRGLARTVGSGLLPDSIRLRQTRGAQVPEAPSLIARHAARYREALRTLAGSAWCQGFLDLAALGQALEPLAAGRSLSLIDALAVDRAMGVGLFLADLERGGA